ncbi:MAG TPA: D-hexose-6-phosphate mutarotase [Tepidisphaeraceae bacterium]|nr:D-hexose-6-phosphate mutarotase [Tepidisphaeraceae bacterium]
MMDLEPLRRQFAIPDVADIVEGSNGLPRISVRAPVADAHIYLHGAHVTHFQPTGRKPVLFLSAESRFEPGKAIRGGVPIIFPWFGAKVGDPAAPMHGFARTAPWELTAVRQAAGGAISVVLELRSSELTRQLWPHDFRLVYTVGVGKKLELMLEVQNLCANEFAFEQALHTYLAVGDVRTVSVDGLAGRDYLDKTDGMQRKTQSPGAVTITGETDRVYLNTPEVVTVTDPAFDRRLSIEKEGSASTVLWNPWSDKARALADLADDEWTRMLCVETANVDQNAVKLTPGASHKMRASIGIA